MRCNSRFTHVIYSFKMLKWLIYIFILLFSLPKRKMDLFPSSELYNTANAHYLLKCHFCIHKLSGEKEPFSQNILTFGFIPQEDIALKVSGVEWMARKWREDFNVNMIPLQTACNFM
ncbi:hypothetical protein RCL_jg24602.t1 [Rhizophagus clarus]|uniref:Uncharacterized protein n=1 Tax=Rhizophagus clarus TaxID=94130 RepID=A0A8H3MK46_9GLOM|nr:hypothetical protein RCL_jg24602.t1 [Rhizophagus clarus]